MNHKFSMSSIKKSSNKIIIPPSILEEMESLPCKVPRRVEWQPWEDELLLKYGKHKSLKHIAKLLNKKPTTTATRYRYLLLKQDGTI